MDGWFRAAADCASRRNRAWNVGSLARSIRSRLIATVRPSRLSTPLRTSAMPPRPSDSPSSYRPPTSRACDVIPYTLLGTPLTRCSLTRGSPLHAPLDDVPRDRSRQPAAGDVAALHTGLLDHHGDRHL